MVFFVVLVSAISSPVFCVIFQEFKGVTFTDIILVLLMAIFYFGA